MTREFRAWVWLTCLGVGLVVWVVAMLTDTRWLVIVTAGVELLIAAVVYRVVFPPEDDDPPEGEDRDQAA